MYQVLSILSLMLPMLTYVSADCRVLVVRHFVPPVVPHIVVLYVFGPPRYSFIFKSNCAQPDEFPNRFLLLSITSLVRVPVIVFSPSPFLARSLEAKTN